MAELDPIPETFWEWWPVKAPRDVVVDGVVFHPTAIPGVYEPHEMGFWLASVQITDFRLGARALVEMEREKRYGKY